MKPAATSTSGSGSAAPGTPASTSFGLPLESPGRPGLPRRKGSSERSHDSSVEPTEFDTDELDRLIVTDDAPATKRQPRIDPFRAVLAVVFGLALRPVTDPDLFWHLATGRWILDNRAVPMTDPFSWSVPGRDWVAHEWLTEVAFELVYRLSGFGGLVLMSAVLIAFTWAIVSTSASRLGGRLLPVGALVVLGAFASAHTWGPRPQIITLMLFAWYTARLRTWAHDLNPSVPWIFVPAMAIWSNMHGGFVFGLTVLGAFCLGSTAETLSARILSARLGLIARGWRPLRTGRETARLWLVFVGCVVASLATPNGITGLIYPFTYLGDNASTRYVGEWVAPWMDWRWAPFYLLAAFSAAAMVFRWKKLGIIEVGLMVFFGYFAFDSVRNIPSFAVVAVPLVAAHLRRSEKAVEQAAQRLRDAKERRKPGSGADVLSLDRQPVRRIPAVVAIAVVMLMTATSSDALTYDGTLAAVAVDQPVEIAEALAQSPADRGLLNHYNYGGYLIWKEIPVFVDGRPDMYGDKFVDDYWLVNTTTGAWRDELRKWNVDRVLYPKGSPLANALRADGWKELASDQAAVLLARP
jgi:hypothetical protein